MTVVKNREIKRSSEFKEFHIMLESFSNKAPFLILTPAILLWPAQRPTPAFHREVFKLNYMY